MSSKTVNISLPEALLKKLDSAAKDEFTNRSDYIRDSIVRRLKHQKVVDEWGDEGEWETVVDFRAISPNGVPVKEVLTALKKLNR
ncbi:MAG TPA: ribbon-helix-helix domain-containing protein [Candidatus Saccharimonadales bacterium]|nr:ribbon-helix-helix domain-containing protein [Candidatus Saccharimonadales bacterium]